MYSSFLVKVRSAKYANTLMYIVFVGGGIATVRTL